MLLKNNKKVKQKKFDTDFYLHFYYSEMNKMSKLRKI